MITVLSFIDMRNNAVYEIMSCFRRSILSITLPIFAPQILNPKSENNETTYRMCSQL